jgi:hypothetical protein
LQRFGSLVASAALLLCIIAATAIAAHYATPSRGQPSIHTVSVTTTPAVTNSTQLIVDLAFSNGTILTNGSLLAGSMPGSLVSGHFVFNGLGPGSYPLNLTASSNVYLPPITARVSPGTNILNLTIYQLATFHLAVTWQLAFNGTQPGPIINVVNGSAVRIVIQNNTTQVFDIAVVQNLYNTSADNVLFNSLSSTISAGGSADDTFIVSTPATFYYQSMTGNQAKQGEYGYFSVNP